MYISIANFALKSRQWYYINILVIDGAIMLVAWASRFHTIIMIMEPLKRL